MTVQGALDPLYMRQCCVRSCWVGEVVVEEAEEEWGQEVDPPWGPWTSPVAGMT